MVIHSNVSVVSIGDIERSHRGITYGTSISFYHSHGDFVGLGFTSKSAFYFRAYCYLLVLGGSATIVINQREFRLAPGALIFHTPLHLVRYADISADFEFKVLALSPDVADVFPTLDIRPRIVGGLRMHALPVNSLSDSEIQIVKDCFCDIERQLLRRDHKLQRQLIENALTRFYLEYDCFSFFDSLAQETPDTSARQKEIVDNFIELVSANFKDHRELTFYSNELNITPQYLTRVVRHMTGVCPSEFISEIIYAEARNMLARGGCSVQSVADTLGFSDQSSFGKFFKRCSGFSPKEFLRNA